MERLTFNVGRSRPGDTGVVAGRNRIAWRFSVA